MKNIYVHDEVVHNTSAAREILPLMFKLYNPGSIIDIGCGIGTWLSVAQEMGVNDVIGIDGAHLNKDLLKVEFACFKEYDLTLPFNLNRKFDLGICLEVAEHLPERSAQILIKSLVDHADVIMFSAAIPGQGGQNHLNEQWPSYWQDIFRQHNYEFEDYFRPKIWMNENIEFWYRQNIFLVVNKNHAIAANDISTALPLVHPDLFRTVLMQKDDKITRLKQKLMAIEQGNGFKKMVKSVFKKSK